MTKLEQLSRWQRILLGLVILLLAYLLGSRAFDTGSWWQYFGTLILLIIGMKLLIRGIKPKK